MGVTNNKNPIKQKSTKAPERFGKRKFKGNNKLIICRLVLSLLKQTKWLKFKMEEVIQKVYNEKSMIILHYIRHITREKWKIKVFD